MIPDQRAGAAEPGIIRADAKVARLLLHDGACVGVADQETHYIIGARDPRRDTEEIDRRRVLARFSGAGHSFGIGIFFLTFC
jgi:hypothetical protein